MYAHSRITVLPQSSSDLEGAFQNGDVHICRALEFNRYINPSCVDFAFSYWRSESRLNLQSIESFSLVLLGLPFLKSTDVVSVHVVIVPAAL